MPGALFRAPGTGGHTPAPQGHGLLSALHSVALAVPNFLVSPVVPQPCAFYQHGLVAGRSDPGAGTRGVSGTLFPKMGSVLEGMTAPQLPEQGLSAPLTSGVYRPAAP